MKLPEQHCNVMRQKDEEKLVRTDTCTNILLGSSFRPLYEQTFCIHFFFFSNSLSFFSSLSLDLRFHEHDYSFLSSFFLFFYQVMYLRRVNIELRNWILLLTLLFVFEMSQNHSSSQPLTIHHFSLTSLRALALPYNCNLSHLLIPLALPFPVRPTPCLTHPSSPLKFPTIPYFALPLSSVHATFSFFLRSIVIIIS